MKLVTFTKLGQTRIGKVIDGKVLDLSLACPQLPTDMKSLLCLGDSALAAVRDASYEPSSLIPLSDVRLEAPVLNPSKYLAIGMNYADHVAESARKGVTVPKVQIWFNKQVSCINGPYDPIEMPRISEKLDYEVELCVVIGKRCRYVSVEGAKTVIAGYMVANDVTARDIQLQSPTWTLGKSFDTHGPIGPWLVTADEVNDPHALNMRLSVNGEPRQSTNTSQMVHNIFQQIAHLSAVFTLEPGDLIATGTPMGVGAAMDPPRFLVTGDVVRAEIDGIGFIQNTVISSL